MNAKRIDYKTLYDEKIARAKELRASGNAFVKEVVEQIFPELTCEKDAAAVQFDSFWLAYDKKVERKKAKALWDKLSKRDQHAALDYIPKYKAAQPNKYYRKNPTTFLRNRSWEDEIVTPLQQTSTTVSAAEEAPRQPVITADDRRAFELVRSALARAWSVHTDPPNSVGFQKLLSALYLSGKDTKRHLIGIAAKGMTFNKNFTVPFYWDEITFDNIVSQHFPGYKWIAT